MSYLWNLNVSSVLIFKLCKEICLLARLHCQTLLSDWLAFFSFGNNIYKMSCKGYMSICLHQCRQSPAFSVIYLLSLKLYLCLYASYSMYLKMYNYVKWRNICYFMYMIMFHFENAEIKTNKQKPTSFDGQNLNYWIFAQHKTYDHSVQWSENQDYYLLAL